MKVQDSTRIYFSLLFNRWLNVVSHLSHSLAPMSFCSLNPSKLSSSLCQFCQTTSIARRKQKTSVMHTDSLFFSHEWYYLNIILPLSSFLFDTGEWVYHAFIHQLFLANHKVPHEVSSFSIFLRTICSKMIFRVKYT